MYNKNKTGFVYLISIADIFTIINSLLGFSAIIFLYYKDIIHAFTCVLFSVIVDGIDGLIANRFNKKCKIGKYLDITADTISFIIAPALMMYVAIDLNLRLYSLIVCGIIVISGILRLARFCYLSTNREFVGLPAPAFALIIVLLIFLEIHNIIILLFSLLLCFLMVSNLKYIKLRGRLEFFAGILVLLCAIFHNLYYNVIQFITLFLAIIYVFFPLASHISSNKTIT